MSIRRTLALTVVAAMATGWAPSMVTAAAPQGTGVISGHSNALPLTNWSIQLIDVSNGQVVETVALDPLGNFKFENVVSKAMGYMVQLFDLEKQEPKCQKGPFEPVNGVILKTDIDLNCGFSKAGAALIAGVAAGVVTVVAVALHSAKG